MNATAYSGYQEHTFYFVVERVIIIIAKTANISCFVRHKYHIVHIFVRVPGPIFRQLFLRKNIQFKDIFFDFYPCLTPKRSLETPPPTVWEEGQCILLAI